MDMQVRDRATSLASECWKRGYDYIEGQRESNTKLRGITVTLGTMQMHNQMNQAKRNATQLKRDMRRVRLTIEQDFDDFQSDMESFIAQMRQDSKDAAMFF